MTFLINLLVICTFLWVLGFILNGINDNPICKRKFWSFCFNEFYLALYLPGLSEIFIAFGLVFGIFQLLIFGVIIGIVAVCYIVNAIWIFWSFARGD